MRNVLSSFLLLIFCFSCSKDESQDAAVQPEKTGAIGVCYVEVNQNNLLNVGSYSLAGSGDLLFDIAIIFASNINLDQTANSAVLHHNENVTRILNNPERYIRPLQDKGIKVLLSVLGNHQGVGVSNFTSRESAMGFATQLADAVDTYELDGIDIDDEYAKYGEQGQPLANDSSFVFFLEALRTLMPDKIISFYNIGPAASRLVWKGQHAGTYLDYSWNAYYGSYQVPQIMGLAKNQLGPSAVWIGQTPSATASSLAQRTVQDGYGVYLYYDLKGVDVTSYLSIISTQLYQQETILRDDLYSWP